MSDSTESPDSAESPDSTGEFPDDPLRDAAEGKQTVDNDAVAGETIYPGPGDGNDGPTGGAEREAEPEYDEHDPGEEADVDLDDQ